MADNFVGEFPQLLNMAAQMLHRYHMAFRAWSGEFDHFLDLAEVHGMGTRLGYWCFHRALSAAAILRRLERAMLLIVRHMRELRLRQAAQQHQ